MTIFLNLGTGLYNTKKTVSFEVTSKVVINQDIQGFDEARFSLLCGCDDPRASDFIKLTGDVYAELIEEGKIGTRTTLFRGYIHKKKLSNFGNKGTNIEFTLKDYKHYLKNIYFGEQFDPQAIHALNLPDIEKNVGNGTSQFNLSQIQFSALRWGFYLVYGNVTKPTGVEEVGYLRSINNFDFGDPNTTGGGFLIADLPNGMFASRQGTNDPLISKTNPLESVYDYINRLFALISTPWTVLLADELTGSNNLYPYIIPFNQESFDEINSQLRIIGDEGILYFNGKNTNYNTISSYCINETTDGCDSLGVTGTVEGFSGFKKHDKADESLGIVVGDFVYDSDGNLIPEYLGVSTTVYVGSYPQSTCMKHVTVDRNPDSEIVTTVGGFDLDYPNLSFENAIAAVQTEIDAAIEANLLTKVTDEDEYTTAITKQYLQGEIGSVSIVPSDYSLAGKEGIGFLVSDDTGTDGTLLFFSNGSYIFSPADGFVGTTSFTYQVIDEEGESSGTETETITINPVLLVEYTIYLKGMLFETESDLIAHASTLLDTYSQNSKIYEIETAKDAGNFILGQTVNIVIENVKSDIDINDEKIVLRKNTTIDNGYKSIKYTLGDASTVYVSNADIVDSLGG